MIRISGETTEYAYDCNGNTLYKYVISYAGELLKITIGDTEKTTINGSTRTITTGTDDDGNTYVQNDKAKITSTTDDFGRTKEVVSKVNDLPVYELKYSYANGSDNGTKRHMGISYRCF